jgi:hypothetical protein
MAPRGSHDGPLGEEDARAKSGESTAGGRF